MFEAKHVGFMYFERRIRGLMRVWAVAGEPPETASAGRVRWNSSRWGSDSAISPETLSV